MECVLGRLLTSDEVVHHKDRQKDNNHPDNLEVCSRSEHMLEHAEETRERTLLPMTEQQVREALEGRSTEEAAQILGIHHQTLRNRFDHLLEKRRSPGADLEPEMRAKVQTLADDPTVTQKEAARRLNMNHGTLRLWLRRYEISWTSAPVGRPKRGPK